MECFTRCVYHIIHNIFLYNNLYLCWWFFYHIFLVFLVQVNLNCLINLVNYTKKLGTTFNQDVDNNDWIFLTDYYTNDSNETQFLLLLHNNIVIICCSDLFWWNTVAAIDYIDSELCTTLWDFMRQVGSFYEVRAWYRRRCREYGWPLGPYSVPLVSS